MRLAKIPLWGWWGLAIVLVSLPWVGFTARPQWDRVYVAPFTDPQDKPIDLLSNIAMFVPFGFWFIAGRDSRHGFTRAAVAAAAVSVVAEAPQLFSTLRNPSATDVISAMVGGAAGVGLRRVVIRLARAHRTP